MAEKPTFCDECGAKLGPNNEHWRSCSAAEVDLRGSEQANDQGIYLTKLWFWISTQPAWRIILGVFALVALCLVIAQPFSSRDEGKNAPPQRFPAIGSPSGVERESMSDTPSQKLPSIGKQVVTLDNYLQIRNDMSYSQVVRIIGTDGVENSRNKIEGIPGVMDPIVSIMYTWTNGNGSGMNAIFQNDKLFQKSQFALK